MSNAMLSLVLVSIRALFDPLRYTLRLSLLARSRALPHEQAFARRASYVALGSGVAFFLGVIATWGYEASLWTPAPASAILLLEVVAGLCGVVAGVSLFIRAGFDEYLFQRYATPLPDASSSSPPS